MQAFWTIVISLITVTRRWSCVVEKFPRKGWGTRADDGLQREEACIRALSKFTGQCGRRWRWNGIRTCLYSRHLGCTRIRELNLQMHRCKYKNTVVLCLVFFYFNICMLTSLPSVISRKCMSILSRYVVDLWIVGSECEAKQVSHAHVFLV